MISAQPQGDLVRSQLTIEVKRVMIQVSPLWTVTSEEPGRFTWEELGETTRQLFIQTVTLLISSLLWAGVTGTTLTGKGNWRLSATKLKPALSEKPTKRLISFFLCLCSKVLFGEYNCRGRGAERRGRVPWSRSLTQDEVKPFLGREFIFGDQWLRL